MTAKLSTVLALCAAALVAVAAEPAPAQPKAAAPLKGDPARGKQVYQRRCTSCHSLVLNRDGPRHLRVFGERAGSLPDYEYSDALRASNVVWNERTLDLWLKDPEAYIPGNSMGYAVASARDRADVIAYLKSLAKPRPR